MEDEKANNAGDGCTQWKPDLLHRVGPKAPLEEELARVQQRAVSFAGAYKGKLGSGKSASRRVLAAVREYEAIHEMAMGPCLFAHLLHASDTRDRDNRRRYMKTQEAWAAAREELAFFPLELAAFSGPSLGQLAEEETLSPYRPFLLRLIRKRPHMLSEPEEKVLERKNLSGRTSQRALYDELMGSVAVLLETGGGTTCVNAAGILALQHGPDRSLRQRSLQLFLETIESRGMIFANLLSALILDHHLEDRLRGHPDPMHRRRIENGLDAATVEAVMRAVENRYSLARRYFRSKAGALGLARIESFDISAPLETVKTELRFPEARTHVLEAVRALDPGLHSLASEFFEGGWIDARVREGKLSGAFCASFSPSQHPFISINYSGNLRDAMVMAHELGHGIHYRLASGQSFVNFEPPPVLAETAAAFMEIALARHLMREEAGGASGPRAVLSCLIEGIITTVFRQNVLTRFEQAAYRARPDHALSGEEIGEIWMAENDRLFGGDLEMTPGYRWGWATVPHFFHRPFYCCSYVLGNLLAIALFQRWEERGRPAVDDVIRILASGGRDAPPDLLSEAGLNTEDASLWDGALDYVEGLIDAFDRPGGKCGFPVSEPRFTPPSRK